MGLSPCHHGRTHEGLRQCRPPAAVFFFVSVQFQRGAAAAVRLLAGRACPAERGPGGRWQQPAQWPRGEGLEVAEELVAGVVQQPAAKKRWRYNPYHA